MKKCFFTIAMIIFFSSCSDDSGIEPTPELPIEIICPPGDVVIEKQADTNIFTDKYKGCTEISGSLSIGLNGGSLDNIQNIVSVTGDLKIVVTKDLADLSALNNLKTIGGNLILENNVFSSVIEFENLESIGENIIITDNYNLTELTGFPKLKNVGGDLIIEDNRGLLLVDAFHKIDLFEGDITIKSNRSLSVFKGFGGETGAVLSGDISLLKNDALTDVDAFHNIKSVEGNLLLKDNYAIKSFKGFSSLENIRNIEIHAYNIEYFEAFQKLVETEENLILFATKLKIAPKFESMKKVGGRLQFSSNSLENIDFFISLEETGELYIDTGTSKIDNFSSMNNLKHCSGSLTVGGSFNVISGFNGITQTGAFNLGGGCYELKELNGFSNLQRIEGHFKILQVPKIERINGFNNLAAIQGDMQFLRNEQLQEINGFDSLEQINSLLIQYNGSLSNICGLNALTSISEDLSIRDNRALISICGFNRLSSVTHISIFENQELNIISGFSSIESIQGDLSMGALKLTSLSGFQNLKEIGRSLTLSSIFELQDLKGFSNLNFIGESLWLSYCDNLLSLDGLENVNSSLKQVVIKDNQLLNNISGINNIASITEYLNIQANLNLSDCALDLLCKRIETDNINMKYNGPQCSSMEDVYLNCK